MAFGRKKKEETTDISKGGIMALGPVVEEAEVIEQKEPEKEWPVVNQPTTGGETNMEQQDMNIPAEELAKRSRALLTDHWVDAPTAAAFEQVRKSVGVGFPIRAVTDAFFGHPSRIHTELPEPPPIESYNAADIGAKVKAALLANL